MFNKLFDLNRDGKLDAAERALEYMNLRTVTSEGESDDDGFGYEEDNDDEEDDF